MLPALFSVLLAGLSHLANAAPLREPTKLLAVAPHVTSPNGDTVWKTGEPGEVAWDTTDVPAEAQDYTVKILLGYLEDGSEHLDLTNPLAEGLPILQGYATVTVPSGLPHRTDYIVVLLGDSGDSSDPFTIIQGS